MRISPEKLHSVIDTAQQYETELLRACEESNKATLVSDFAASMARKARHQALVSAIRTLDRRERIELLALTWVGRGEFEPAEWSEALGIAQEMKLSCETECLATMPLLPDYLEEGLSLLNAVPASENENVARADR
jgi:hypothetical protein